MRRPVPIATVSALFLIVLGIPFFGIKFTSVDPTVLPQGGQRAPGRRRGAHGVPALPRDADPGLGQGRAAPEAPRPLRGAGSGRYRGRRRGRPAATAARKGSRAIQAISANPFNVRGEPGDGRTRSATLPAPPGATVLVSGATADFVDFQGSLTSHLPIALRDHRHRDPGHPLPDDRLGGAADQVADHERAQPERRLRPPGADLPGRPPRRARSTTRARARSSRRCRSFSSRSPSGSRPTTPSSCSRGSRRRATTAPRTRSRWRSDWSGPAGSSPPRRSCSRSRSAPSRPREIIFIKENGVGTALAVLIDASIIRALLVPSLMELLGKWNWWAPAPLRRLHERFGISETGPTSAQAH